jgi:hypothetical protein
MMTPLLTSPPKSPIPHRRVMNERTFDPWGMGSWAQPGLPLGSWRLSRSTLAMLGEASQHGLTAHKDPGGRHGKAPHG